MQKEISQSSERLLSTYLQQKRLTAALPWLKGKILDYGCGNGKLAAYDEHNKLFTRKDLLKMAKSLNLQFQHYSKFLFGYNQLCILKKE